MKQQRRPIKALVVDDSLGTRLIIGIVLESLGCVCSLAQEEFEALQKLDAGLDYRIIFMDCEMPVMDGFAMIHEIRQKAEFQNTKIIYISSKHCGDIVNDSRCMTCKVDGFADKPITKEAL